MARGIRVGMVYLCGALWLSATLGEVLAAPLAGSAPDRRPAAAPTMREGPTDAAQRMRARLPADLGRVDGLGFVREQGRWYTPFDRQGMPPPYDIHGWHRAP